MRYIRIDKLKDIMGDEQFNSWQKEAEEHLNKIRSLSKKERSVYFSKNNIWTKLYPYLSQLSDHKCWYSESPENSAEWEVDHYRPKNESRNIDGSIILKDGYWWLAYNWRNFRLIGSLANKLRKDRFSGGDQTYGKGTYFPLDLECGEVADPEDFDCSCEFPLLLDPTNFFDTTLISFDSNGEIFPTFDKEDEQHKWLHNRAALSIIYYGLDHTPIKRGRGKVWTRCELIVDLAQKTLKLAYSNPKYQNRKHKILSDCYSELLGLADSKEPYSMVVRSYVLEKAKDPEYCWLGPLAIKFQ